MSWPTIHQSGASIRLQFEEKLDNNPPPASILVPRPSPLGQRKCAAGRGSQAPEKIRRHRTKREQKRWTAEPARKKKKKKREKGKKVRQGNETTRQRLDKTNNSPPESPEARKGEGGKAAPGPVEIIHDGPDWEKETQARGGSMRKLGGQVDRATEGLARLDLLVRLDWLDWPVSGDEGDNNDREERAPQSPEEECSTQTGPKRAATRRLSTAAMSWPTHQVVRV
ncbi:hypothetical protein BGZ61DRAFT_48623 [Ilyonectria robusta]|uniref:uncharacterized protein n=1 Tax=Ilyonectria robusta TaxID=1079257 RepID=UPI001E8E841A|nr:uncharacterized protein BGZ61DRAFT_48623 [Ilyonectria robusta]KAH8686953.1 hypothetical protein BGZ61DRAFT_48623 [Ilyonectria robusta]